MELRSNLIIKIKIRVKKYPYPPFWNVMRFLIIHMTEFAASTHNEH